MTTWGAELALYGCLKNGEEIFGGRDRGGGGGGGGEEEVLFVLVRASQGEKWC